MPSRKIKPWRTRKDFDRDFFDSYRISKLQEDGTIIPMGSRLIAYQEGRHKINLPKRVAAALSVLDDLILDAILWHHSFAILILNRKRSSQALDRSLLALQMKLTQDATVARNLIRSGFDAQAKNLLRSIDEHANAICYLCVRPEAADEFVETEDEESANRFWWKHIRGCRPVIDEAVGKIVKEDALLKELSDFRSAERQFLSATHHPSYIASTMPFMVPYRSTNVTMYMFGFPSEHSYRTGKLLFYILAETAMLIGILNKNVLRIIEEKGQGELQKIVEHGRLHLGFMVMHLVNNWDAPIFSFSPQMEKFLKSLSGSGASVARME